MKTLRLGGYGVTSWKRPMFWLLKFETSGSYPVYGVHVLRLRPLTSRRTSCVSDEKMLCVSVRGSVYETEISRSLRKPAFSKYEAPLVRNATLRACAAAVSARAPRLSAVASS